MTAFTNAVNLNDADINGNPIGSNPDNFRVVEPTTTPQVGREVQLVARISW